MNRKMRNKKLIELKSAFQNPTFVHEYKLYKIPLWPCGTWPLEKDTLFKNGKFLFAFTTQVMTATILFTEVVYGCAETEVLIDYIGLGVCTCLAFVKTATCWIHSDKMFDFFVSAAEDHCTVTDPSYKSIMLKYAKKARKIFLFQMIATYISATSFPINAILFQLLGVHANLLPMQTVCTISNLTGWIYPSVFAFQCVEIYFTATGNIGHDLFFIALVMHICGQLYILEKEFSKLNFNSKESTYWEDICNLIDRHRHLLFLTSNLDYSFWIMLLIQLGLSVTVLCILGIQILVALQDNNMALFFKHTLFTSVVLLQLYLYAWTGDYLESNFDRLTNAVYSCDWYKMPPKILRNFIFILHKTNRSAQLKAGYIYEINMVTFAAMLKMMMSMFSIVRLMFIKEEEEH